MRNVKLIGLIAVGLVGCSDDPYDPNAPAIDPAAPRVHITSPERGAIAGEVHSVTVTGTATDDVSVESVTVNDLPAVLGADGTFTVQVPLKPGTTLLHAVAKDKQGNTGKESRAVVAGPMADLASTVPNALTATISSQTFEAIAKGTSGFLKTADLQAMVAPMNPVLDIGGGPDCLYAQAQITSMKLSDADITLLSQYGGVFTDVELSNVLIGMHLQYAVACVNGARDITIGASHITVSGKMTVGVVQNKFDIHLDQPNVQITGFDLSLGGIPGEVVNMLSLDTAMGPILGFATEKFLVPMMNKSLAGLNETKTVDVLGTQVAVEVNPSAITFTPQGGLVQLDTSMRAKNDAGKYVYVPNSLPLMDLSHGFQLAVADDGANQLLTSLWTAKALDKKLALNTGSYGEVGKLYDLVQLQALSPPFVDASGTGLKLTVGDSMATFSLAGAVVTKVAIQAQVDIKVSKGMDGLLRLDVGQPTTYVDILDEDIEGANQLSNAQFEAVTSFALGRIVAVASGSLGAVPLPAFGGVAMTNLSIASRAGYLVVEGDIQ